jgi:hypothetical protein
MYPMARDKDLQNDDAAPSLDQQQQALARMISAGVSAGIVEATNKYGPVRQIPITQYCPKTPLNPLGLPESERPQLTRHCFQNGFALDQDNLNDEQRRLLNQLRPGSYVNHLVDVIERYPEGGGKNVLDIRYNNATVEQRMELKSLHRNFTALLQAIVEEQTVAA